MRKFYIICAAMALLAVGCAKTPSRVAIPREAGVATAEAGSLANRIKLYRQETRAVRAMAWILLGDAEEERQTDAAMAIVRPEHIRVDAMDALADVWAQAASDGRTMWLYLPAKSRLYSGRATVKNLHRLARFDFEVPEIVDLLAGSPPIGADASLVQVGSGKDAHFRVEGTNVDLWTGGKSGKIVRLARFGNDGTEVEYSVAYDDYRRVGRVFFPFRIEATFPSRGARIVVVYKTVELGASPEAAAFLPPASGRAGKVHSLDGP
ncbi:MAG: DUF4292 domain-containing protein [Pseudomonadota bacterium]